MDCSHQAPLSVEFSRQEYWSGLLYPTPGDLQTQGSNPCLLHWQADSLLLSQLFVFHWHEFKLTCWCYLNTSILWVIDMTTNGQILLDGYTFLCHKYWVWSKLCYFLAETQFPCGWNGGSSVSSGHWDERSYHLKTAPFIPQTQYSCVWSLFSLVRLFATLWSVSLQAPLSMGVLQARILEWVATPSSRGSRQLRDWTHVSYVSCTGRQVLYH